MVRKRMVSTVMSLMMAAAVLTTVPVTNNVKAADKEITSGDYTYVKESNGKTSYAVLTSYRGSETNLVIPEELDGLQELYDRGVANGVKGLKILTREEVLALEPNLSENVEGALFAPTGGIICPFTLNIALAENGQALCCSNAPSNDGTAGNNGRYPEDRTNTRADATSWRTIA